MRLISSGGIPIPVSGIQCESDQPSLRSERDLSAGLRVFNRVIEQIGERLSNANRVDFGQAIGLELFLDYDLFSSATNSYNSHASSSNWPISDFTRSSFITPASLRTRPATSEAS